MDGGGWKRTKQRWRSLFCVRARVSDRNRSQVGQLKGVRAEREEEEEGVKTRMTTKENRRRATREGRVR